MGRARPFCVRFCLSPTTTPIISANLLFCGRLCRPGPFLRRHDRHIMVYLFSSKKEADHYSQEVLDEMRQEESRSERVALPSCGNNHSNPGKSDRYIATSHCQ